MSASIRVFGVLAEAPLRQQIRRQWRSNGIALCGIHAECTESLIEEIARLRPDVVIADAELDHVRDFVRAAALRFRVPVVALVRGAASGPAALRPLEWGAVNVVSRTSQSIDALVAELDDAVHAVCDAQVVELLESVFPLSGAFPNAAVFDMRRALRDRNASDKIVVVGAGLGGPTAMRRILDTSRRCECSPVLYTQRISESLLPSLVQWLATHTGARVQRAVNGQVLEAGNVYVAGARDEILVQRSGEGATLRVSPPNGNGRPLDTLLASVARAYGEGAVGILLSGHGDDGCEGMKSLREAGGLTIAQDRASSLIYELPGRVRESGGAIECLPINEIAERILMLMPSDQAARV